MSINLETLFNELSSEYFGNDSEKLESFFLKLEKYYSSYINHSYAEISRIIFFNNNEDEESNEILIHNLTALREIATSKESTIVAKIDKLLDHAHLSLNQMQYINENINKMSREVDSLKIHTAEAVQEAQNMFIIVRGLDKTIKQTENKLQSYDNQVAKYDEKIKVIDTKVLSLDNNVKESITELKRVKTKIYTEFVVILGIFSAIIFATFGGLEILNNVLGNISKVHTGKLLVFSSLSISGIILLLFTLLSGIAKLTGLNLRSCGCPSSDNGCKHNVFKKHPTIIVINLALLYICIIGVAEYVVNYRSLLNNFVKNYNVNYQLLWTTIFLLATGILMWFTFRFFYNKNNS